MDTILEDWKKLFTDFSDSAAKGLAEIRRCKAAVQSMRPDYVEHQSSGRFIRSEDPIIISSPNIIIGNVDADGNLLGGNPGSIILRSSDIKIEGVGASDGRGSVVTKATSIRQIAVDAGIDGNESVVVPDSEIVSQARHILIESSSDTGVFIDESHATKPGVSITSDSKIEIDSSSSLTWRKARMDMLLKSLSDSISGFERDVDSLRRRLDAAFKDMDKALSDAEILKFDDKEISSKVGLLDDLRKECELATINMNELARDLFNATSLLTEARRRKKVIEDMKSNLPKEEDYKQKGSGTSIRVNADKLSLTTFNGDGDESVSADSGVLVAARNVKVSAADASGALMEGSRFEVDSRTIGLNAASTSYDDDKKTKGKVQSVGEVNINARTVNVSSLDTEFDTEAQNAADKSKITGLAEGGRFSLRTGDVKISTVGTDGVAAGSLWLNSKTVGILSADLEQNKDKEELKKFADGGHVVIGADKIVTGAMDDKLKTTSVEIVSKASAIVAEELIALSQKDSSSIVLTDNSVFVDSKANKMSGETEIGGKTKLSGGFEVDEVKATNLSVSGELKTQSISDGIKKPASAPGQKKPKQKEREKDPFGGVAQSIDSAKQDTELAQSRALKHERSESAPASSYSSGKDPFGEA